MLPAAAAAGHDILTGRYGVRSTEYGGAGPKRKPGAGKAVGAGSSASGAPSAAERKLCELDRTIGAR